MAQDNSNFRTSIYFTEKFSSRYNPTLYQPNYYDQLINKTKVDFEGWGEKKFHGLMVDIGENFSDYTLDEFDVMVDFNFRGKNINNPSVLLEAKKRAEELNRLKDELYIKIHFVSDDDYLISKKEYRKHVLNFKAKILSKLLDANTDTIRLHKSHSEELSIYIFGEKSVREVIEKYYNISADKLFKQLNITPPSETLLGKVSETLSKSECCVM